MTQSGSEKGSDRVTRRRLLGATLSAGLAATAGCLDGLPPFGAKVEFGRVDAPAPDPPTYRDWLPAPAELGGVDDDYEVFYTVPGGTTPGDVDGPSAFPGGYLIARLDYFGIDYLDFDAVVRAGPVIVALTDVDRAAVGGVLTDSGYQAAGSYAGYDLYERSDYPRAAAVGDGAIVWGEGESSVANVRTTIDATAGEVRRYHEVSDDVAVISERVGATPFSWIFPGRVFAGGGGSEDGHSGISFRFSDGDVYVVNYHRYPVGASPTEASVKEMVREKSRAIRSYAVDVTVEDRLATIEMWMSGAAYRKTVNLAADVEWPSVTWGVDHDREAETLTVVHEAGDPIPASEVSVELLSEARTPSQFDPADGSVDPGDAVTVDLSNSDAGDGVLVWFRPEETKTTTTLFHYRATEANGS